MQRRTGQIHQLSVSAGGVPKHAVKQARVTALGLEGDWQRDRRHHGGPQRALCLFALEVIDALRREGHDVQPGTLGENVTLRELDWRRVVPGTRLRLGAQVVVEITDYTAPCLKNARWFADGDVQRINQWAHPGLSRVYARVLEEGWLRAGEPAEIVGSDPAREPGRIRTVHWRPPR